MHVKFCVLYAKIFKCTSLMGILFYDSNYTLITIIIFALVT